MKIKIRQSLPSRLTTLASLDVKRLCLGVWGLGRSQASNLIQGISGLSEGTEGHHEVGRNVLSLSL